MADSSLTKEVYVDLDLGNLCVTNVTKLQSSLDNNFSEGALIHVASLGVQELIKEIFKLPSEFHDHVPVAKLPEPLTLLPREKPVPKEKPETKWEKFAKAKGIVKRKKDKMVYDEDTKEYRPAYGYRSKRSEKDWMVEVPANADPNVDYFAKKGEEKKERIAKNELRRLRNLATANKVKVSNLESVDRADKHQLARSVSSTKVATASMGRFTETLPNEKPPKDRMRKRKFKENYVKDEKDNYMKIFENINKQKPKLDVQQAVQRYIQKPFKETTAEQRKEKRAERQRKFKHMQIKNSFRGGKKKFDKKK